MKILSTFLLLLVLSNPLAANVDGQLRQILKDNDIRPLKVTRDISSPLYKLGEKLFSDNDLSGNKNISCQTCHHPSFGGSDGLPLPIGEGGDGTGPNRQLNSGHVIPRNSPHVFNLGIVGKEVMFWDGRVTFDPANKTFQTPEAGINGKKPVHEEYCKPLTSALSAQAMFPPTSHEEMRGQVGSNEIADAKTNFEVWELLTDRIKNNRSYDTLLRKAYPQVQRSKLNFAHLAEALGNFQANKFLVTDTPFDRYLKGNDQAMSPEAKKGALLFYGKARCVNCHSGNQFTDNLFHNVAFPQVGPGKEEGGNDRGLFLITKNEKDLYLFKTPGLRNVSLSAPYGHSGSLKTLRRVVEHYTHPMRSNHHYDGNYRNLPYVLEVDWQNMNDRLRRIDPILGRMGVSLTQEEIDQVTRFLSEGLTQETF